MITETSLINAIVTDGASKVISDKRFLELEINKWKNLKTWSNEINDYIPSRRGWQVAGERYYNNDHDILRRKRTIIGQNGQLEIVENLPNNKIIDNQYAKMVDQKTNYLVGKPFTITSDDEEYAKILNYYFGKKFMRTLKDVAEDSLNQGTGWIYVYVDDTGELSFKRIESYELNPFWTDSEHERLDCATRVYPVEVYKENEQTEIVEKVEVYSLSGIDQFVLDRGMLKPDEIPHKNYFRVIDQASNTAQEYNWKKIPLICFKSNSKEMPLIKRVKCLQDGINTMLSDFENNMQMGPHNNILVLKNYDGQNLGEFRRNLAQFGAVKVRTTDGGDGGVESISVEFSSDNFQAILNLLKKALVENAKGYDAKDDRLSGNPNQINIMSMYNDIDLDANSMETCIKAAFEEMVEFVDIHLINSGKGDYRAVEYDVTFNRSVLMNMGEMIDYCAKSVGLISNETILKNHPFVENVDEELKLLEDEKKKAAKDADNYAKAFGGAVDDNTEPTAEE